MEAVRARLGDHVHHAAGCVAELGRHNAALYFELLDCIDSGVDVKIASAGIIVRHTVKVEAVEPARTAVDAESGHQHAAVAEAARRLREGAHARRQNHQR